MPRDADTVIAELLAEPWREGILRHDAPPFDGLSTADVERVRGHVLASFETRGVPADAVDLVAEELRTGESPVALAGAARAVRGLSEAGDPRWRRLLQEAAERLRTRDVYVRWQAGAVAPTWLRTARAEILAVLDELPAIDVLGVPHPSRAPVTLSRDALSAISVEDQAGEVLTMDDLLGDEPTVLAFFYTRCMNPAKCSLTITRLGDLVRDADAPRIIAMTYDPSFDVPERLRRYGADRGFAFGERARFVRSEGGWSSVRALFGLSVGYGPATVNDHAREVFLVSSDGSDDSIEADPIDAEMLADAEELRRRFS